MVFEEFESYVDFLKSRYHISPLLMYILFCDVLGYK